MCSGSWMIHSRYGFSDWDSPSAQVNLRRKLCIWIQLICKLMDTYSAQMMACYWSAQWIINTQVNASWQPCRLGLLFQSQCLKPCTCAVASQLLSKNKANCLCFPIKNAQASTSNTLWGNRPVSMNGETV